MFKRALFSSALGGKFTPVPYSQLYSPPYTLLKQSVTSTQRKTFHRKSSRKLAMAKRSDFGAEWFELDDDFQGLQNEDGTMTIAGFGSLLSETSARTTFPELVNFRVAKIQGWRRIFAHTCDIFFKRGIARLETGEISSLSCEPAEGSEVVVVLFEVPYSPKSVAAFIAREHEFRFVAVAPVNLDGTPTGNRAVLCAANTDEEYKRRRCPPEEWEQRYTPYGITSVWRNDVLPCRTYLRHCVLAAQKLSPVAYDNFMNHTYLSDRKTLVKEHLAQNPDIMDALPPAELLGRYSG